MRLATAEALGADALTALFNAGFSDYVVPLQLDPAALREHVRVNDIDLARSPVAIAAEPAAFALLGVRGTDAWIGGMATAPAQRRRGLAARVLHAAVESAAAAGCDTVSLEVVDRNEAAVALYLRAGFDVVRDLVVWTLPAAASAPPAARALDERSAQAWIAAHRDGPEPWQRSDATLDRMRVGRPLTALVVERGGAIAAAVLTSVDESAATVLQVAALDADAAADVLRAAAGPDRTLRVGNVPAAGSISQALAALGAEQVARQHEMRLRVGGG